MEETKDSVVIKFAGDSGDGMQLTGNEFTQNAALFGNDVASFPDFPAEIRAPKGTIPGVSGFQLQFSSHEVFSPGDQCDVLVAMNAAALKVNLKNLKPNGILIVDSSGFDSKNLKLAKVQENPLENGSLSNFILYQFDFTRLTSDCLKDSGLDAKSIDRCKNIFVLGFVYWLFERDIKSTEDFINTRFAKSPDIMNANKTALKAGFYLGETTEVNIQKIKVHKANLTPGSYRSIMGNQGIALGLMAAASKSKLHLFYGSYPITPASDILHELAKHTQNGVTVFQAEDEIAAAGAALGASYGGSLGVTGTSGPGLSLKSETISLAISLELPLVVIDVQRAGPSTGMPTKTEQSDLLMALYGRHGEAPCVVIAAQSPGDAFYTAFEGCKISIEHMTPVIVLSDAYVANGAEPWLFPQLEVLPEIKPPFYTSDEPYMPYSRDEMKVRKWLAPGQENQSYRIGGIEKEDVTGNISYDPFNHELMVHTRAKKIELINEKIPVANLNSGMLTDNLLIVSWGSSYGIVKTAVEELRSGNLKIAHLHLRYINPLQKEIQKIFDSFDKILVVEMNNAQLYKYLKSMCSGTFTSYTKIQGQPFQVNELKTVFYEHYN